MRFSAFVWLCVAATTAQILGLSQPHLAAAKIIDGIEVDDRVEAGVYPPGIYIAELANGDFVTISNNQVHSSSDLGETWSSWPLSVPGHPEFDIRYGVTCATDNGALITVGMEFSTYNWSWNSTLNAPNPDCSLDVWAMRSLDGGQTWGDAQQLLDGYCGALQDIIQTSTGEVIVPVQPLLFAEARHATLPFYSTDDGASWQASDDLLDIGGRGHHDGSIESNIVELQDGRTWMLLRTNLDQFYSSYSPDGGRNWSDMEPSQIDASSSPCYITRLDSGRLAMVWNRLYPEGETTYPRVSGQYSATPSTWMRHELSLVLSEDDGQTWTEPVVIAQIADGGRLAYPTIFEPTPGRLWISTAQGSARLAIDEEDFVGDFGYVFSMPAPPPPPQDMQDSGDFLYKYEFDVDPTNASLIDLDGNSQSDWDSGGTGPKTLTAQGTVIMDSGAGSAAYYESGIGATSTDVDTGDLWPNVGFTTTEGFTLEWRMKVISDTGTRAAFALVADPADKNVLPVLEIGDDVVMQDGVNLVTSGETLNNSDDFHTFRLVRDAVDDSNLWWLWRDGKLVTQFGFSVTREWERNALYIGDFGSSYEGVVEMDYFRLTPGAFAPELIPGDANSDGLVDDADAAILAENWLKQTDATWYEGDFNGDGAVDEADITLLAANWQVGVAEATVPEPSVFVMLLAVVLTVPLVRRGRTLRG